MRVISLAATLSCNLSAARRRVICSCFLNRDSASGEISRRQLTPHQWNPSPTTARLESDFNCPETLSCAPRSIKWTIWDVMAVPWAPRTFAPRALTGFIPLFLFAGLLEYMGARELPRPTEQEVQEPRLLKEPMPDRALQRGRLSIIPCRHDSR